MSKFFIPVLFVVLFFIVSCEKPVTLEVLPELTTTEVSQVSEASVQSGGFIVSDGGYEIHARGVCWSLKPNPTVADSSTIDAAGTGRFVSNVDGLIPNTTYYLRAYATNKRGTSYGLQETFTTKKLGITTNEVSNISINSAVSGGAIAIAGGVSNITTRGVCWSTSPHPTVYDFKVEAEGSLDEYSCTLTELEKNTTYYVKAYVTNSSGTYYGNQERFTTRDGSATLITQPVFSISANYASVGVVVNDDGGSEVIELGFCWSTSPSPTIADNKASSSVENKVFYTTITGLSVGTTYFLRAYAINAAGISYGNEVSFATNDGSISLTTNEASSITASSASIGGIINNAGGLAVTDRGICWSSSPSPTIASYKKSNDAGVGPFVSSLSGLTANTMYYARAYATNAVGTSYGNEVSFTTRKGIINITTHAATSLTINSATSGGMVTDDGGSAVTARGVCWSTSPSPTLADSKTSSSGGMGSFSSNLSGLAIGTTYYIRAYATNAIGTSYGNEISFTTRDGVVGVTTNPMSSISLYSATAGGVVTDDGGATVTSRGVCWSTSPLPTTDNSKISTNGGTGSFISVMSRLNETTVYYARAYAINSIGTYYGEQVSFQTAAVVEVLNPSTGKVWMDRNMDASRVALASNDVLSYGDLYQWGRGADGHEKRSSVTTTARSSGDTPPNNRFIIVTSLPYNWRSTSNTNLWQGVNGINNPCPAGYRVPTIAEWYAERKSWSSDNAAGAFASPLKLPLGGFRDQKNGQVVSVGEIGAYWSSSIVGDYDMVSDMYIDPTVVIEGHSSFASGKSVRCIKD